MIRILFVFLALSLMGADYRKVDDVYIEETKQQVYRYTIEDIDRHIEAAQRNISVWQAELDRWNDLKQRSTELDVARERVVEEPVVLDVEAK